MDDRLRKQILERIARKAEQGKLEKLTDEEVVELADLRSKQLNKLVEELERRSYEK